jgi:hypothetical protein
MVHPLFCDRNVCGKACLRNNVSRLRNIYSQREQRMAAMQGLSATVALHYIKPRQLGDGHGKCTAHTGFDYRLRPRGLHGGGLRGARDA